MNNNNTKEYVSICNEYRSKIEALRKMKDEVSELEDSRLVGIYDTFLNELNAGRWPKLLEAMKKSGYDTKAEDYPQKNLFFSDGYYTCLKVKLMIGSDDYIVDLELYEDHPRNYEDGDEDILRFILSCDAEKNIDEGFTEEQEELFQPIADAMDTDEEFLGPDQIYFQIITKFEDTLDRLLKVLDAVETIL